METYCGKTQWGDGCANFCPFPYEVNSILGGALGDTEVEVQCGGGEEEFARGKHPGGVVFFKNSEDVP